MASKLFSLAAQAIKKAIDRSAIGRLAERATNLARRGLLKGQELNKLGRRLARVSATDVTSDVLAAMQKAGLEELPKSVSKRQGLLGRLATKGGIAGLFAKVLTPDKITGPPVSLQDELNAAANLLRLHGLGVRGAIGLRTEAERESGRKVVAAQFKGLADGEGIWTGEMIPVTSSNVHSIGFRADPRTGDPPRLGTLLIRFLGTDPFGHRVGPGSLYEYQEVPTALFRKFKWAMSKGKFVWDNVRVRGTVSGHRFAYDLVGISQGYVPRQAVLRRGRQGEWFIPRRFAGQVSVLPMEQVRRTSRADLGPSPTGGLRSLRLGVR